MLGLITILAADAWALVLVAPQDSTLGYKDFFLPTKLFGYVFARMPEMRRQVWMGTWGIVAIAAAFFLVGGMDFWMDYLTPKRSASRDLVSAVSALAANQEPKVPPTTGAVTPPAKTDDAKADSRPTEQCVIIGYNLDESQHITALHLATTRGDGKLVYVGSVKKGISEEASKELLQRLKKNVSQQPLIKVSGTSATWVAPKVYCEVHQDGYDDANHLKSPALANVLAD